MFVQKWVTSCNLIIVEIINGYFILTTPVEILAFLFIGIWSKYGGWRKTNLGLNNNWKESLSNFYLSFSLPMKSCCIGFDKMVNCQNCLNNFPWGYNSESPAPRAPFLLPLSQLMKRIQQPGKFFWSGYQTRQSDNWQANQMRLIMCGQPITYQLATTLIGL